VAIGLLATHALTKPAFNMFSNRSTDAQEFLANLIKHDGRQLSAQRARVTFVEISEAISIP
jgi:hypothetical protein